MTWQMDPFGESNTTINDDSEARLGKAILAIHGNGDRNNGRRRSTLEDGSAFSVSATSFSDASGSMMDMSGSDAYDGDYLSASEQEASDYFSESATESLEASMAVSASLLGAAASADPNKPKKKVRRKKKKAATGAGKAAADDDEQQQSTAAAKKTTAGTKPRPKRKKVVKKKVAKAAGENSNKDGPSAEEMEWWHTSTINAGSTMEDFSAYSNTEGETDNNERRVARRKKRPPESAQQAQNNSRPNSRSRSRNRKVNGTDNEATATENDEQPSTNKPKRKSKVVKRKSVAGAGTGTSDAENKPGTGATKKAPAKRRVSKKKVQKDGDEIPVRSFAEDTYTRDLYDGDESIAVEALFPSNTRREKDAKSNNNATSRQKLLLGQQSLASMEKDASLDMAKHTPASSIASLASNNNNANATKFNSHKNREMMDAALSKGGNAAAMHMSISTMQTSLSADQVSKSMAMRGKSPEKRTQRRKTIDNTVSRPTTTATKNKARPRRMKSHDPSSPVPSKNTLKAGGTDEGDEDGAQPTKTIRRTKSLDPDAEPKRNRTPSRSRRVPKKKQPRSASLNHLAATGNLSRSNNLRRRRLHAGETSPSGNSKMSLGLSSVPSTVGSGAAMMDRSEQSHQISVQSMPLQSTRRASTGMPTRTKSHESMSKLPTIKQKKAGGAKRGTSKDRIKKKAPVKKAAAAKQQQSEELDEDESIRSMEDSASMLTGHIAKDSQGRNNLPHGTDHGDGETSSFSKSEASTIHSTMHSTASGHSARVSALSGHSTGRKSSHKILRSSTGSHNNAINAYFGGGRDSGDDTDIPKGTPSFEDSLEGSMLSDYSSEGERSRNPLQSSGEFSGGNRSKTISPFSAHATTNGRSSHHTAKTSLLVSTDHTHSPLIPDSDSEESVSFHVPAPKTSEVDDAPPTPVADSKEGVPTHAEKKEATTTTNKDAEATKENENDSTKTKDEPPKEAAKNDINNASVVSIQGPAVITGPALDGGGKKKKKEKDEASKTPKLDDLDDDDDDPVPPRPSEIAAAKPPPKPSLWDTLCCRSAAAVQ